METFVLTCPPHNPATQTEAINLIKAGQRIQSAALAGCEKAKGVVTDLATKSGVKRPKSQPQRKRMPRG